MDDYPNPDEEYELRYEEEMEALMEMEKEVSNNSNLRRSKNSLSFDSPSLDKENVWRNNDVKTVSESRKRQLSLESLTDVADLDVLDRPVKKHKSGNLVEGLSHECGITSSRIPKWPFMPVSTDLGEKLYVKITYVRGLYDDLSKYIISSNNSSGLLATPYNKLKAMAEETLKKSVETVVEENFSEGTDLWVDKYKPKTYFDLLSDEAVNRTLLNWLKMWDKVVFNKEVKVKSIGNDDKSNSKNELDKDGRPYYKIALLCGPPGLGKTTLAHVVSELAGYNVLEVNASDDRTIDALKVKLEAATQIQSVMGNRKPHCLVLDEIDGTPAQTVEFLLKYLNGKITEKSKKGKKDKPDVLVKRPVICICNELYTPSLRQLRQQAFVVHFPHTSSTKLAQRLLDICRKQDIKTDLSTLTLLCDKSQNDIRSCISTLYFFKSKDGQRFKSVDVMKSSVGQKDIQKGMFNLWKEIFQTPIKKGKFFSSIIDRGKEEEVSTHINYSKKAMDTLHHIVHIFQSAGDYDRLLQGVFENFPKSKFSGSTDSLAVALQWFTWFDLLDSDIKKNQNFILMQYLPYSFAAWHSLFSSSTFWKISYPSVGYENHLKETKCKQILSDVLQGLSASVRSYNSKYAVLLDILPMFNVILVPPLRCVNPTLFNENEKKDFKELIDVMIEYDLNFTQQRKMDGTYCFQYDPKIDELSRFNTSNASNSRSFSYNMKQTISHEIELEKLRRNEEIQTSSLVHIVDNKNEKSTSEPDKAVAAAKPEPKPKENKFKENEVQYKDFFGRVVKIKNTSPSDKALADKNNPVKSPVWFSFKEGYNNAVKKDITMADIL